MLHGSSCMRHADKKSLCKARGRQASSPGLGPGGDTGRPRAPGSPAAAWCVRGRPERIGAYGPHVVPVPGAMGVAQGLHLLRRGRSRGPIGATAPPKVSNGKTWQATLAMGAPREGPLGGGRRNPCGGYCRPPVWSVCPHSQCVKKT